MMKLIVDLKSLNAIGRFQADGLIFSSSFSTASEGVFSLSEIFEIVAACKKNGILSLINIDRIIEEDELTTLYEELDVLLKLDIDYFIFSDYAILKYFLDRNLQSKLIYNPKTLINNKYDALYYHKLGVKVGISNELSLEDIKAIVEVGNCVFEIYGHHQMFYSKRKLLSSYAEYANMPTKLDNLFLWAQEEKREEEYPLIQTTNGTFMYTSERYHLFKELVDLRDTLLMGRINTLLIPDEEVELITSLYKKALSADEKEIELLYEELLKVNANLSSGFLNQKSVVLRERKDD